jgi:hypothetical protein
LPGFVRDTLSVVIAALSPADASNGGTTGRCAGQRVGDRPVQSVADPAEPDRRDDDDVRLTIWPTNAPKR